MFDDSLRIINIAIGPASAPQVTVQNADRYTDLTISQVCLLTNSSFKFRDITRLAALTSFLESSVGRKRMLIASPYDSNFQGVVELITAKPSVFSFYNVDLTSGRQSGFL